MLRTPFPVHKQAGPLDHLIDGDYSRDNLVAICEAAVVNVEKWSNRDSPLSHENLGLCWVMLKAGCEFIVTQPDTVAPHSCVTDDNTIWLNVYWPSFNSFEYGTDEYDDNRHFYIPTPQRLRERLGRDWY